MSEQKKSLILIIGMPGSGKSTAARAAAKLGFRVFSFGDIVRDEVRRRGLAQNEANVEKIANWFHAGREYMLAHRLEKKLRKIRTQKPFYVVEGARSPRQLSELKRHFDAKILAVTLPARIRWRRQLARGRADIRTPADAKERDARELHYGIGKMMRRATWRISSDCTEKVFRARCARFFASLLK